MVAVDERPPLVQEPPSGDPEPKEPMVLLTLIVVLVVLCVLIAVSLALPLV